MDKSKLLETIFEAMCQIKTFLEPYLALTNTHGAEFLSDCHWDKFLSKVVQSRLLSLSKEELVNLACAKDEINTLGNVQSDILKDAKLETCGKEKADHARIQDLELFVAQARSYHLDRLGVLSTVDEVFQETDESIHRQDIDVISEAMSVKKLHEVGIMVEAVSELYRLTNSNLVVDVGSGKGYFASELSRKHAIPVVGLDSSDINTHGASNRDKQLARKWAGLERKNRKQKHMKKADENLSSKSSQGSKQSLSDTPCEGEGNDDSVAEANGVSVDSSKTDRMKLGSNSQNGQGALYVPVTMYVDPHMDLCRVVQEVAPGLGDKFHDHPRLFLSGLHTCGSLAVTTTRLFLQDQHAVGLCCVGCCYQLMEERMADDACDKEIHFPLSGCGQNFKLCLGRNARNLASQSVHRIAASGQLQGGDFLWRALLNVLLKQVGAPIPERIMGMRGLNKRCKTFQEYAVAAFKKLDLSDHLPDLSEIERTEAQYATARDQMSAFFQVKLVLAPVIESLILLDRLAFLLEQDNVSAAYLVQMFDPVTSPRCFALVAMKKEAIPDATS